MFFNVNLYSDCFEAPSQYENVSIMKLIQFKL